MSRVFSAGVITRNWPTVPGLLVRPNTEVVLPDTMIRAELQGVKLGIDCEVTAYEPSHHVRIEGKSRLARAMLDFALREDENGTEVVYGFEIEGRGFAARALEPTIRTIVASTVPQFADGFKNNIVNYIEQ